MNNEQQIQKILELQGHKHIKIYKLHQLGVANAKIAALLGTNAGHVYNALKSYKERPEKAEIADKIQ